MKTLDLVSLPGRWAVCRLPATADAPEWARGPVVSLTWTADELSIVCPEDLVPDDVRAERGWRAIRVRGAIDFSETGIVAALTVPLAEAKIGVFVLSTFDTDYLFVASERFEPAVKALRGAGHRVTAEGRQLRLGRVCL